MNPVDHPHGGVSENRGTGDPRTLFLHHENILTRFLHFRVTTNISVRPQPSRGTLPRVKRRVLSPPGGRVCCAVPRRQRSKGFGARFVGWDCMDHCFVFKGTLCVGRAAISELWPVLFFTVSKDLKRIPYSSKRSTRFMKKWSILSGFTQQRMNDYARSAAVYNSWVM